MQTKGGAQVGPPVAPPVAGSTQRAAQAKGSNKPLSDAYLGTEGVEEEGHNVPTTPIDNNAIHSPINNKQHSSSSATRSNKRAKTSN
jgi:hypothetical protein